ncbi:hypothetical protein [Bacillus arachidis]|uniref:hypothetical protein n=1 Tax=Bacillus arachidis TaxID=2819290 RepID=UPI0032E7FD8D
MGKLRRGNIIILIILAIIILAIGCTSLIIHNRNITKEKAAKVSIEHMKKKKNIDFVVTDVKIEHLEREGRNQ